MDLVGYSDRLTVTPRDSISFMVSSAAPSYKAQLVRLRHGDENPEGPGFKEEELASGLADSYPGRIQELDAGSHLVVPGGPGPAEGEGLTIRVWAYPTRPGAARQGLVARFDPDAHEGYALVIDEQGAAALCLGSASGTITVATGVPLLAREWYFIGATVDPEAGTAAVLQRPLRWALGGASAAAASAPVRGLRLDNGGPLVIAGWARPPGPGKESPPEAVRVDGHYNGKLDSPAILSTCVQQAGLEALAAGAAPRDVAPGAVVACYDFSVGISTDEVHDTSGNGHNGLAVNLPMRAVTGRNWTGSVLDWPSAPDEYAAIHFHDDDLADAGWEVDFRLEVPELASGVYAVRLRAEGAEDYLPFFVRPPAGVATADIALLLPTCSYLAYANEHYSWTTPGMAATGLGDPLERLQPQDRYMADNRLLSLYDAHSDGSSVTTSSWKRPLVSLRPKFFMQLIRAPHQFNADLHLVDWLTTKGFAHDVLTDHVLHEEGVELLGRYRVVLTGSHPEYWTEPMLDAMEAYLAGGGRLLYLGGNGFFWSTAIRPDMPHVIEVRRSHAGVRPSESEPGEEYMAATGEPAGKWRYRGRPPQRLVGVGYTTQGSSWSRPYRRLPDSHDPRCAFVFEGIGDDEVIGDFGLVMGGAGGAETDRVDRALGTPPHTLVLAVADGFSDHYQAALDDFMFSDSKQSASVSPLVRADMVYFETPDGGAVFSPASIAWCGSLSHNGYDNNVSRITENVLGSFAAADFAPRVPGA